MRHSCVALGLLPSLAGATWTPPAERHVPNLHAVRLVGRDGSSLGELVAEEWSAVAPESKEGGRGVTVRGLSRMYLTRKADASQKMAMRSWSEVSFNKLSLLDQQLSFTLDLSAISCGCNAAVCASLLPPHYLPSARYQHATGTCLLALHL
jgi:hypothetical protein